MKAIVDRASPTSPRVIEAFREYAQARGLLWTRHVSVDRRTRGALSARCNSFAKTASAAKTRFCRSTQKWPKEQFEGRRKRRCCRCPIYPGTRRSGTTSLSTIPSTSSSTAPSTCCRRSSSACGCERAKTSRPCASTTAVPSSKCCRRSRAANARSMKWTSLFTSARTRCVTSHFSSSKRESTVTLSANSLPSCARATRHGCACAG